MAKVGFLLLCAVLIHTGYALQCYNCVSTAANKNCDDLSGKSNTVAIATCGKTAGAGYSAACIKKVVEDKTTKVQNTTRACIITKADGVAKECDAASDRSNVLACEICSDELCNAADNLQLGLFSLLSAGFTYVLIKYIH